jgi:hypothetical protein
MTNRNGQERNINFVCIDFEILLTRCSKFQIVYMAATVIIIG